MSELLHDLRYTLRGLARTPTFALLAVLTLALGIGANSAIFSVIHAVVLQPLGYPAPERLVFISSQFPTLGFDKFWVSPPEYFELGERARSYASIGAYTTGAVNLGALERPERVHAVSADAPFFRTLGVPAARGRTFSAQETLPNADPVAVLSWELWQRVFGGRASIVGEQVEIDGVKRTVVGIMPAGFDIHDAKAELWLPIRLDPANRQNRGSHYLQLVGRLAPGVTASGAQAELDALLAQWERENGQGHHSPTTKDHRLQFTSLQREVVGNIGTALWVLQAAVGFVLLIACANMANLLLARAESRHKEFAIRTALGAGRARLLRQFVTEGLVLSTIGGVVGLGLAYLGLHALLAANADGIPRSGEIGLDPSVLAFTAGVVVLTGVVFGLAPLTHLGAKGIGLSLREGGTRTTSTAARRRVRSALVIGEVALAVMLVIGAGLMLRSFWNLMRVDSGFDRAKLTTFEVVLPAAKYQEMPLRAQFFGELTRRLSALPGVEGAAAMSGLPPQRDVNANDTEIEGFVPTPNGPAQNVDYYQYTTPDYLQAMGIRLASGRSFAATDGGGAPVVLINETMARVFWPKQDAVGRRVRPSFGPNVPWFTIVGVVKDVKQGGLDQKTGTELYFDIDQLPATLQFAPRDMFVVVRSTLPLAALAPSIHRTVAALDRSLPVVALRTMDDVFSDAAVRHRFLAQLLAVFAGLALLLAAIGTNGILAYSVSERTREIGIRMALGAHRGSVLGMVLAQGLGVTVVGLVLGVAGALALNRLAASLLFGVAPTDPATFVAVAGFIALVALVACVVPARRATRVDPMVALRES
jgi:predicted permease